MYILEMYINDLDADTKGHLFNQVDEDLEKNLLLTIVVGQRFVVPF